MDLLLTASRRMMASGRDELVVVEEGDSRKIVGVLARGEIVGAYEWFLLQKSGWVGRSRP